MFEFTVKLADRVIRVNSIYKGIRNYCEAYLCEEEPEFTVTIQPEDIEFEKEKNEREAELEGLPAVDYVKPYLETLAVYRKITDLLLPSGTILFHGSVIAVDDVGYLFTAKSGTGKSTHTALWREMFGERAVMINDDKPLLRITDQGVTVYGTPWNGKHKLGCNRSVPLKAICILERGSENIIERVPAQEVLPLLLQQCNRPKEPQKMMQLLEHLDRMGRVVNFYRLHCNMEPDAARVSYEGMCGEH